MPSYFNKRRHKICTVFTDLELDVKAKNSILLFLVLNGLFLSNSFADQNSVRLTCEMNLVSSWKTWTPWGQKNYDQNVTVNATLPLVDNPLNKKVIFESESLNDYFQQGDIKFLANASLDPITKRKKIHIGMYVSNYLQTEFNPKLGLFNVPVLSKYKTWDGKNIINYFSPVMSAVSDSGRIELYNGDYQGDRIKFSCLTEEEKAFITELKPENKKEQFTCNINVKNSLNREVIDELNKTVVLGFSYSHKRDLQPIIEDEVFKSQSMAAIRLMGNLYVDKETNKPKFLLGIYKISRGYNPKEHSEYWTPEYQPKDRNGNPRKWFYAMPLAESTTDSDYIELRSDFQHGHTQKIKVECMKLNNRMMWSEEKP